jgi:metal-sulfur cluster biosynthetic enzyme
MSELDLRGQIDARLATITEPCSIGMRRPVSIREMGLIESVEIEAGHVRVTLCLTDPGCVHFRGLQNYIRDVLNTLDGVRSVEVTQTTQVLWTPDRVQERTRAT